MDLHREAMFRYAYLIVHDSQEAEDVTQEALWRIYRHMRRFDQSRAFRPWALGITRNLARNQNRAWGRYQHMIGRFLNREAVQTADVEALSHAQQQAQDLHHAVGQLSVEYQDVIYARFFLGLSIEDCADALGIADGTVKSRSHRALRQLRALIERQYPQLMEGFPHE